LILVDPQPVPVPVARVVESRMAFRERPAEEISQIHRFRQGEVLDQAEQIGSCCGQWASYVVLRQPVQLVQDGLPDPPQVLVEIRLREVIDHATNRDSNR